MSVEANTQELARLQRALSAYTGLAKGTASDALAKKAYDLRIQLYRGFAAHKWRENALVAGRRRFRSGRGVRLRPGLIVSPSAPTEDKRGRKLSDHQRLVWSELSRRQAGRGVLAAAWLHKRWRRNSQGSRLASFEQRDRGGKRVLSTVELTPLTATFTGSVEGLDTVATRYGITATALRAVSDDTEIYLRRKLGEDWAAAFRTP